MFDLDNSGTVETTELLELGRARRELGHAHTHWGEKEADEMARWLDENGDGLVSCDEFVDGFMAVHRADADACEQIAEQFKQAAIHSMKARQHAAAPSASQSSLVV